MSQHGGPKLCRSLSVPLDVTVTQSKRTDAPAEEPVWDQVEL